MRHVKQKKKTCLENTSLTQWSTPFPLMLSFGLTCLMFWGSRINQLTLVDPETKQVKSRLREVTEREADSSKAKDIPVVHFLSEKRTVSCAIIIVKQLNCMEVQLAYVFIRAKPNYRTQEWRKRNRKRRQRLSQHGAHLQTLNVFLLLSFLEHSVPYR
jgi:hypothetical protein